MCLAIQTEIEVPAFPTRFGTMRKREREETAEPVGGGCNRGEIVCPSPPTGQRFRPASFNGGSHCPGASRRVASSCLCHDGGRITRRRSKDARKERLAYGTQEPLPRLLVNSGYRRSARRVSMRVSRAHIITVHPLRIRDAFRH